MGELEIEVLHRISIHALVKRATIAALFLKQIT